MRTESTLNVSESSKITNTLGNVVTSTPKKFPYKGLKNTQTVSMFCSLLSLKSTHADISMLKHACSVNGDIKQPSKSKNFIRVCVFFIRISIFFTHMRKYGRSVKAALVARFDPGPGIYCICFIYDLQE